MLKTISSCFKAAQIFLKGKKTYLAGTIILLEGLGIVVDQITGFGSAADALEWLKQIMSNDGLLRMTEALAIFGFRAAIGRKS